MNTKTPVRAPESTTVGESPIAILVKQEEINMAAIIIAVFKLNITKMIYIIE